MKALIIVGCKTDHGGVIILGDVSFLVEGKAVHLDGMTHFCPKCKVQSKAIASNQGFVVVSGKSAVADGDSSTCGSKYLKISDLAVMSNGASVEMSNAVTAPLMKNNFIEHQKNTYDEQLQLRDINGEPYANLEYLVTFDDGSTCKDVTDDKGNTKRLKTNGAVKIISVDLIVNSSWTESCFCGE
ncbi:PAAR domain-containing protein [Acinetobacter sp. ULE_I001]|uniref:PAAR domain-containing protein n=1 Tax=unclassified Acinetobacter TaxID=196816 RepID=UPI003AF44911